MSKYARVENNIVMEIIDFNPEGKFTDEIVTQFVECPDDTKQNMIYENNQFSEYVKVLTAEEQRQVIINQLAKLDTSMTRTEENIITHMINTSNYQPYQREIDTISQKQALRLQLSQLQ